MLGARLAVLVVGIGLLAGVCGCSSKASAKPSEFKPLIPTGTGLFGSHEFRSTLKSLPNWTRVMAEAETQTEALYDCNSLTDACSSAALSWQSIIKQSQSLSGIDLLKKVNSYFNRWPYRLDIDVYGISDYWATPEEFLRLSGDCEDYCITKYYALRRLGISPEDMRIVLLKDTIRNVAHAVLAVKMGEDSLILDNMSDLVLSHRKYEHYLPQYSVNEFYRWAHIAPKLMR